MKGRVKGQWTVTISRRVDHPDGSFGGVVVGTVDVSYFVQYYQQFDVGKNGVISLLTRDGIMLARSQDNDSFRRQRPFELNDLPPTHIRRRALLSRSARWGRALELSTPRASVILWR